MLFLRRRGLAQTTRSVLGRRLHRGSSQARRAIYAKECAACHGAELTGGESAPRWSGGRVSFQLEYLTVGDLFERIRQSMPQDDPGRLSRQQDADILAFMLSANKFPAGKDGAR